MKKYTVGIDLGGTKIYTAVSNPDREILARNRIPTEARKGREAVINNIIHSVTEAVRKAGITVPDIGGIGIGVPGPVDCATGTVRICPNIPGWKKVPVRKILEDRFGTTVQVENDARVAALAEARMGAGKGFRHIFYITVSTGIGGAIIIDRNIYHGGDGMAGEVGHMKFSDGTSFENTASGTAIERIFKIRPEELMARVDAEDPAAVRAFDHLVHYLGISLANIATLLNPQVIIIGGGLSNIGSKLIRPVEKKAKEHAFSVSRKTLKIRKAKLANDSGILGALELCRTP